MSTTSQRPSQQPEPESQRPRRSAPRQPEPRKPAKQHKPATGKRETAAMESDVRRARMELAETVSEVVTRANELPTRAGQAVRRGAVHPATLTSVGVLVTGIVLLVWRRRAHCSGRARAAEGRQEDQRAHPHNP